MSHESSENPATLRVPDIHGFSIPAQEIGRCPMGMLRPHSPNINSWVQSSSPPLHEGVCGTGHQQEPASVTKQPGSQLTETAAASAQLPVPSKAITFQQHDKPANTATCFPEQGAQHLHSALRSEKTEESPPEATLQPALKSSCGNLPKETGYRRHWSPLNQDLLCCNIIDVN